MKHITLSVQISEDKSQLIICAKTEVGDDVEDRNYFVEPVNAVEMANALLHGAEDCGMEIKMQTMGISDEKRVRLITRCEHVIRSLAGKKVPYVASQVVDTILAEVL